MEYPGVAEMACNLNQSPTHQCVPQLLESLRLYLLEIDPAMFDRCFYLSWDLSRRASRHAKLSITTVPTMRQNFHLTLQHQHSSKQQPFVVTRRHSLQPI